MGCGPSVSLAVLFPLTYVGFLHIADHDGTDRNDPHSIRKRSIAAVVNNVLSVAITYFVLWQRNDPSPFRSMGFRSEGTLAAIIWPATLIGVLYTGQWVLLYLDGQLRSMFSMSEWKASFQQYTWVRDVIVGPVTEEITFRCCCVSLLKNCVSPTVAIFVSPLPFACSHLHHIGDDRRRGFTQSQAIAKRVFQLAYTYLFGVYATYLFLNSGHAFAPIVTHAVCNCLGLPLFNEIG
ncbi:CAAX prenyl protease 2, partial [Trichostrongylus colubriformis]